MSTVITQFNTKIFDMYKFPQRLKELMDEQGLSQKDLGDKIGVSQAEISRWLSGERKPSVDCLIFLSEFFKCSVDYLIGIVD